MSIETTPQGAVIDVTLVLDTNAYASGDVLVVPQEVTNFVRIPGAVARIDSIQVNDEDDNGAAFDLIFMSATGSLGTINASAAPTDAVCRLILGSVSVLAADFVDLGGARVATFRNIGLMVKPATDLTRSIFVGAICRSGTPTYSAGGLKLRIGLVWG